MLFPQYATWNLADLYLWIENQEQIKFNFQCRMTHIALANRVPPYNLEMNQYSLHVNQFAYSNRAT